MKILFIKASLIILMLLPFLFAAAPFKKDSPVGLFDLGYTLEINTKNPEDVRMAWDHAHTVATLLIMRSGCTFVRMKELNNKRGVGVHLKEAEFTKGKHEYLPIPEAQIDYSKGVYAQNTGYN